MSYYFEPSSVSLISPPAAAGDLIVGRADGNFDRLAIGANGAFLNVSAGVIRWGNIIDTGGLTVTAGNLNVTAGAITMSAANSQIVPGVTTFAVTNNANNANNLLITDAGVVTVRGTLTVQGASIAVGAGPATNGALRLPYQGALTSLDSGGVFNETLIRYNGNIVELAAQATSDVRVTGALRIGAKATSYNAVTTAGWGVPAINGYGRATAQVAAVASAAAYIVGAADGSFIVSGNVLVTASVTHSFSMECAYTDEGGTARVVTFNVQQLGGTLVTSITNLTGLGPYEGVPLHIRVKASTTITIRTNAGGTYTSVTFNIEGAIQQIA